MKWATQPISRTCEVIDIRKKSGHCGKPASYAYEAMGIGWMSLCQAHAEKHIAYVKPITDPIVKAAGWYER